MISHLDNVQSLLNRSFRVKRESCIDFGRHAAGNNLQDLAAELDKEVVKSGIDFLLDAAAVGLAILDGLVNECCVCWLLGCREDKRRIGCCVLRLVLVNGRKVARIAHDSLYSRIEISMLSVHRSKDNRLMFVAGGANGKTYSAGGLQLIE
jgi:hypothetical protein